MFGRQKGEQTVIEPTVESLDAEAAALAGQLAAKRKWIDEAHQELEEANDLGRRAELREAIERSGAIVEDGEERHQLLVEQRDRLERDRKLAKLGPLRDKIAAWDGEAAELRARAAELERKSAEAKVNLADGEDAILHPTLTASERQEVDWLVRQWMNGGVDVGVHLGRMSRRLRKAVQRRMAAIAGDIPAAVDEHRRRARQTWKDAGIEQWEPLQPVEVPEVDLPEPSPPPLPYAKLG